MLQIVCFWQNSAEVCGFPYSCKYCHSTCCNKLVERHSENFTIQCPKLKHSVVIEIYPSSLFTPRIKLTSLKSLSYQECDCKISGSVENVLHCFVISLKYIWITCNRYSSGKIVTGLAEPTSLACLVYWQQKFNVSDGK